MKVFTQLVQFFFIPVTILVAFWVTLGRASVLPDNSMVAIGIFPLLPLLLPVFLFLVLYIPYRQLPKFTDGINKPLISSYAAILLTIPCALIALMSLFIVGDMAPYSPNGDSHPPELASLASKFIGPGFVDASAIIATLLYYIVIISIVILYAYTIVERTRARKSLHLQSASTPISPTQTQDSNKPL